MPLRAFLHIALAPFPPPLCVPPPPHTLQASHVVILLAKKYPNYKIVNFDKLVRAQRPPPLTRCLLALLP